MLTVEMTQFAIAFGPSYAAALAKLFETWAPESDEDGVLGPVVRPGLPDGT
jgi:hypothetical protein